MKRCRKCNEFKPTAQFNKDKYNHDGLKTYCKPCDRGYVANWAKNNRDKAAAKGARRVAAKLKRRPKWIKDFFVKEVDEFYVMAKELEKVFPWKIHVDHIIPMQGKRVSGLDVPWNLQLLSEKENTEKGNRYVEEEYASQLPEGYYYQGAVYTQFGVIPTTRFRQNSNNPHYHRRTIYWKDADHCAEARRRDSLGLGGEEVGASRRFKNKQDPRQLCLPFECLGD